MKPLHQRAKGTGDGTTTISGYAAVFNRLSSDMGFREAIDPSAFSGCDMGGTVALFNHSDNFPLAKVTAGNLRLSTDRIGLRFEADLDPKVSYHNDLIRLIQAGTVDQCSFGFIVAQGGDRWFPSKGYTGPGMDDLEEYEDTDIRVLMSIALLTDCSLVTNPAYTSTFAQVDG